MKCSELATLWPERWPRPDPDNTVNTAHQVQPFCRDFADREPSSISRSEARSWALINPGTARYVRTMFNDLLDDKLLEQNVFAGISIPRSGSKPIVVPTTEQIDALVTAAGEKQLASRIQFAAETGLRYAEQKAVMMPGTKRDDLNGNRFNTDLTRLDVKWQLGRSGEFKKPKTKRGVRSVMINLCAREAVEEAVEAIPAGAATAIVPYLWIRSRKTDNEEWTDLRCETGIWIRWHDLRHYHATQLLDAGAKVEDVAMQLGCRDEEIRNTYGHPDAEKALQRLEGLTDA